jgi:hypothetical protein
VANSRIRTKQNQLITAIEASSDSMSNAFITLLQQCQMAEEFEWRQHQLEHEEEHYKHEEKIHELRRKDDRQQDQIAMVFQLVMTGMVSYWGMKKPHDDKDPPEV